MTFIQTPIKALKGLATVLVSRVYARIGTMAGSAAARGLN